MAINVEAAAGTTRVVVVDDHGVVREGLAYLLEQSPGVKVVGFAATGEEAVLLAARLQPDLIIMDLILPKLSGLEATQRILDKFPNDKIIALSACHSPDHVYRAMRAGARGYVAKSAVGGELNMAVRTVMSGGRYVSPGIIPADAEKQFATAIPKGPYDLLSRREREVLRCVVAGSTSANIARHLSLSAKTVDTYRGRLMLKLGVRNRSQLIRFAIENELLPV